MPIGIDILFFCCRYYSRFYPDPANVVNEPVTVIPVTVVPVTVVPVHPSVGAAGVVVVVVVTGDAVGNGFPVNFVTA